MSTKVYIGQFDIPHEIAEAINALYEAIENSGYDSSGADVCPALGTRSVHLAAWHDDSTDFFSVELRDGEWLKYEWDDDDEK
jgi:hypothetical protein